MCDCDESSIFEIPSEVVVMGKTYEVELVERAEEVDPESSHRKMGTASYFHKRIRIWDCGDEVELMDTFIHEIMHVVAWETRSVLCEDDKENDLAVFSSCLTDTLIRNGILKP